MTNRLNSEQILNAIFSLLPSFIHSRKKGVVWSPQSAKPANNKKKTQTIHNTCSNTNAHGALKWATQKARVRQGQRTQRRHMQLWIIPKCESRREKPPEFVGICVFMVCSLSPLEKPTKTTTKISFNFHSSSIVRVYIIVLVSHHRHTLNSLLWYSAIQTVIPHANQHEKCITKVS